jgi:hypothetical protein
VPPAASDIKQASAAARPLNARLLKHDNMCCATCLYDIVELLPLDRHVWLLMVLEQHQPHHTRHCTVNGLTRRSDRSGTGGSQTQATASARVHSSRAQLLALSSAQKLCLRHQQLMVLLCSSIAHMYTQPGLLLHNSVADTCRVTNSDGAASSLCPATAATAALAATPAAAAAAAAAHCACEAQCIPLSLCFICLFFDALNLHCAQMQLQHYRWAAVLASCNVCMMQDEPDCAGARRVLNRASHNATQSNHKSVTW